MCPRLAPSPIPSPRFEASGFAGGHSLQVFIGAAVEMPLIVFEDHVEAKGECLDFRFALANSLGGTQQNTEICSVAGLAHNFTGFQGYPNVGRPV